MARLTIDLRALQLAAEIDVDRFHSENTFERGGAGFAMAVACRLGGAEGQPSVLDIDRRRNELATSISRLGRRSRLTLLQFQWF